jgi:hypothetical protein
MVGDGWFVNDYRFNEKEVSNFYIKAIIFSINLI